MVVGTKLVEEDCNGVVTVLDTTAAVVDDDVRSVVEDRALLRTAVVRDDVLVIGDWVAVDTGIVVVVVDDDRRPQHLNNMARCQ